MGSEPGELCSDVESMNPRQVDIEQNHIRLQRFGLPNGLQSIRRLDGLELRPSLKRRTSELSKRRVVLDDENRQRHSGVTVRPGEGAPPAGMRMKSIVWQPHRGKVERAVLARCLVGKLQCGMSRLG